jgi:AcrR family transcriptional regulator
MRVRTESRRQAILQAASEVFREVGFERASMAMITTRVGGSKATLYGYFASKEELFAATMIEAIRKQGVVTIDLLDPAEPDFKLVLERFAQAYVRLISSRDSLANSRAAIGEATQQKLGEAFYTQGPKSILDAISAYMAHLVKRGVVQAENPRLAAIHFHALLDAGTLVPLLMGAKPELKPKEAAKAAVDAFLRAYGADPSR